MCVYMDMCSSVQVPMEPEALDPLELVLQVVNCLMWELGLKLRSSERTVRALNCLSSCSLGIWGCDLQSC